MLHTFNFLIVLFCDSFYYHEFLTSVTNYTKTTLFNVWS